MSLDTSQELEERVEVNGVPFRLLMGLDPDGNPRALRCDKEGYLICKTVSVDAEELEE